MILKKSIYFFGFYLRTLLELKTKFSSPATVEVSLPAAHPLFITRAAARAGSPVTRLPSTCFSCSGSPLAFLSFLRCRSSSLSFLSQLSTVLCNTTVDIITWVTKSFWRDSSNSSNNFEDAKMWNLFQMSSVWSRQKWLHSQIPVTICIWRFYS